MNLRFGGMNLQSTCAALGDDLTVDLSPYATCKRLIVVVDLMESVRLMQSHERLTLTRWLEFSRRVQSEFLPVHQACWVKGMGDGLLLQLGDACQLESLTRCMHAHFALLNASLPDSEKMWLRIGCHVADVFAVDQDIYGAGVNLTSRIAGLAGPGQTVVSVQVRDLLVDGLDADLTDMGECHLKHVQGTVRLFRLGALDLVSAHVQMQPDVFKATVAVIPFEARSNHPEHFAVGDLIADSVISSLGRSEELHVLSRLSTSHFRSSHLHDLIEKKILGADYLLTGSYVVLGIGDSPKTLVTAELVDVATQRVIASERFHFSLGELFELQSEAVARLAALFTAKIFSHESKNALQTPAPNLKSYALKIGAIELMHHASRTDFEKGKLIFEHLIDRHQRFPDFRVHLANWYLLRIIKQESTDVAQDSQMALQLCRHIIQDHPDHAAALAMKGYILCQTSSSSSSSQVLLDRSIALFPSSPSAWAFKSVWESHFGDPHKALHNARQACALSPLNHQQYFFSTVLLCALVLNRDYLQAFVLMDAIQKMNLNHRPALRAHFCALVECQRWSEAQQVSQWIAQSGQPLSLAHYQSLGNDTSHVRTRMKNAITQLNERNRYAKL
jgi:adenylate cyclase